MKSPIILTIFAILQFSSGEIVECPLQGIAYISHSKCSQFIICLDGEAAEMSCSFSLYYNPETAQCDFPENVIGCRGGTRPPIGSTTTSTEEPVPTTETPPNELTTCGQSVIADNGTIRYKLKEPYDARELCVFMIKFKSGYMLSTNFTLETHGFTGPDSDAVAILKNTGPLYLVANLGIGQNEVSFNGYGAIVIFRTNSSSGTGFHLSFQSNVIHGGNLPGTYVAFHNERDSPLSIPFPSNFTDETSHSSFVVTSGFKFVSEPDTVFKLTARGWFGNSEFVCENMFSVYSFVNELKFERRICRNNEDGDLFEFTTRGLFVVQQTQVAHLPQMTGVVTWNRVLT